jgi:hypothetical protein
MYLIEFACCITDVLKRTKIVANDGAGEFRSHLSVVQDKLLLGSRSYAFFSWHCMKFPALKDTRFYDCELSELSALDAFAP